MNEELIVAADQIKDDKVRQKVKDLLRDPPCNLDAPALDLDLCPAGVYQHHSYPGGLLEHTLCVVKLALSLCDIVEDVYNGEVNRDLVVSGALLHDVMKVYCYEEGVDGGFRSSKLGGMVDHLTLMVAELYKRDFPLDLIHIIASHHGDVGPIKPKIVEALIVAVADLADSDLNNKLLRGAEYLLRRSGVSKPVINSAAEALRVVQVKKAESWVGLHRLFADL